MTLLWVAVGLSLCALALFSACEAALTSVSRIRLRHWAGKRLGGSAAEELLERPRWLMTMVCVGANLSTVCLGVSAAVLLAGLLGFVDRWPLLGALAAAALATPPAVLIGDVLPKTVVREHPEGLLPALVWSSRFLAVLSWPYVALVNAVAAVLFRLLGIPRPPPERAFTRGSIETLLREGEREGVVDRHEREIIGGIFAFGETPVREVMTPRTEVVSVRLGSSREAIARRISETGFSRLPVFDGSPENIVGMIHALDVLKTGQGERLRVRPTLFVPETMTCDEVLYAMRRQRIQLAVVVDEYGGMAGIVTLEDLVEELVGEIRDEHDREPPVPAVEPDGGLIVEGRTRLSALEQRLALSLPVEDAGETVAGYLLRRLGRVPERGERVSVGEVELEVVEATPTRVLRVRAIQPESSLRSAGGGEAGGAGGAGGDRG